MLGKAVKGDGPLMEIYFGGGMFAEEGRVFANGALKCWVGLSCFLRDRVMVKGQIKDWQIYLARR